MDVSVAAVDVFSLEPPNPKEGSFTFSVNPESCPVNADAASLTVSSALPTVWVAALEEAPSRLPA